MREKHIHEMFVQIAPKYDFLNHLLSFGIDNIWRNLAAKEVLAKSPKNILDLATGTGDFAISLAKKTNVQIIAVDFVEEMLEIAKKKTKSTSIHFEHANALALPYKDGQFDAVCCAFGFRNFVDYDKGLSEISRVTAKNGRVVLLEFPPASNNLAGRFYKLYFEEILPFIGGIISNSQAYEYLPKSVAVFPKPDILIKMMRKYDLSAIYKPLNYGIAGLWIANKIK